MQLEYPFLKIISLYGYLLSNKKSSFSVYIGKDRINGIAQGIGGNGVVIKFIPRWSEVKVGDIVTTSGLDNIFFPNIPVGKITSVKTLARYKEATIKPFADLSHPSLFLFIYNATPYLVDSYLPNSVKKQSNLIRFLV